MHIIFWIIFILIALFIVFLIFGFIRTWQIQHSKEQEIFIKGKIPNPLPDGFYKGHTKEYKGPWIGKSFHKEKSAGMNVFEVGKKRIERFSFKTSKGKGLQDKELDVFKIEYNVPHNSYFLKMVLDEIIEVESGKYLGKAHIRFIPQFPFTVGYFWLEK